MNLGTIHYEVIFDLVNDLIIVGMGLRRAAMVKCSL